MLEKNAAARSWAPYLTTVDEANDVKQTVLLSTIVNIGPVAEALSLSVVKTPEQHPSPRERREVDKTGTEHLTWGRKKGSISSFHECPAA